MSTLRETRSCSRFRPHPQPLSHGEKGARDLVPLLLREKGLGD
ncbi:hypothetical protein FDUTEX481_04101, partial [Tolypothrix sp. PCC 7601]